MTGSIKTKTPKYKFIIPQFNIATWHDYIEDNFRAIDALFYNIFDIQNFSGSWTKTTEYKKDQVLFIGEDYEVDETGQLKKDDQNELITSEFSGRMVKVLKDHTTDNSVFFSLYYFNHKDEYELFADASTAQKFANLAKQYSENAQQSENNAELYKNNAQGYAQEAENSKNIAQQNAQLATNKAESAVSSATVAKNSENSAANSASLAEGYKNDAKKSADSANRSAVVTAANAQIVNELVQEPNLVAVGTDLRSASSNIKNVSSISEQTKNVSDNMSYIRSVDNNRENINKVATNEANITSVAENINNVNITAQNKDNIDTVVSYKDSITTTSTNINAVNNVSENMADVKNAIQSANDAKLWAVGTKTEKPEGSSKYWAEQAQQAAQVYDASETVKGIVRLATSEEVTVGTNDSVAITPLKLKSSLDTKQDKSTAISYDNISNCITEIPQDIKLELNNGTLTLKAGSKVYVPNGIYPATGKGKFELVSIDSDITTIGFNDGQIMILAQCSSLNSTSITSLDDALVTNTYTYTNTGDTTNGVVYLNASNYVYYYGNGTKIYRFGLPLAICTRKNGKITSIDQIFNGFGYIGSTIFALPGVKGLIPNGRNADGSLKNIEFTLDKVITATRDWIATQNIHQLIRFGLNEFFFCNGYVEGITMPTKNSYILWYNPQENVMRYNNTDNNVTSIADYPIVEYIVFGDAGPGNGTSKITSFTPKTVFHALDYNDKSTISGWSLPSSRYIDLTLGASGSTYIASANGYFYLKGTIIDSSAFSYISSAIISNYGNTILRQQNYIPAGISDNSVAVFLPCKKNDRLYVSYYNLKQNEFRFCYAEGEN